MRRLLLPALLVSTALTGALPASAQVRGEDPSLWQLIHPDRILSQIIRSGILAMRSQMDVRYSNLTTSIIDGTIQADDVELVLYDNITGADVCDVSISGLEIFLGDPLASDDLGASLSAQSVTLTSDCVPAEMRPVVGILGLSEIFLPQVTIDVGYDMRTAAATARITTALDGVAAITADLDMSYVTLWAGDGGDPEFNAELAGATVTVDDLGGWSKAQAFLPPAFANPETAGAAATQVMGQMFDAMAEGGPVPKPVKEFTTLAAQGWADFVARPGRLVLETGFAPSDPVSLTPEEFEDGPMALIEVLQPVVRRVPAAERNAISPELVARALSDTEDLTPEERRTVGLALLSGEGAPRAVGAGTALLSDLAQDGDGDVALAMARALRVSDPERAYSAALAAGGTGAAGLRATMAQIERDLPFATQLRLQAAAVGDPTPGDLQAPTRELAARADAHFSGVAAPRSLRHALLYASIAAARGDGGAARLMDRIDRSIPRDGRTTWSVVEAEVSQMALTAWIAQER